MNALVNFERPQMARSLARGDTRDTLDRAHLFRLALGSIYGLNLLAAIALVLFNSEAVFPPDYARSDLALAAALWFCIAAITTLRTPESILLQAKGNFRDLAFASFVSCAVSVVLVVSLLLMASTVWSLAGILAGQAILAIQIWRLSGAWRKSLRPDTQTD